VESLAVTWLKGKGLGKLHDVGVHGVCCWHRGGNDGMEGNGRGGLCVIYRGWRDAGGVCVGLAEIEDNLGDLNQDGSIK
jgi:hypothetical protein